MSALDYVITGSPTGDRADRADGLIVTASRFWNGCDDSCLRCQVKSLAVCTVCSLRDIINSIQ
jgi:hypothetical protein